MRHRRMFGDVRVACVRVVAGASVCVGEMRGRVRFAVSRVAVVRRTWMRVAGMGRSRRCGAMCIGRMRGSRMRASHVASSTAAMIADGLRCAWCVCRWTSDRIAEGRRARGASMRIRAVLASDLGRADCIPMCTSGLIAMLRLTRGRARRSGSIRFSAPGARSDCLRCIATRGDNGFRDRPLSPGLGSRG